MPACHNLTRALAVSWLLLGLSCACAVWLACDGARNHQRRTQQHKGRKLAPSSSKRSPGIVRSSATRASAVSPASASTQYCCAPMCSKLLHTHALHCARGKKMIRAWQCRMSRHECMCTHWTSAGSRRGALVTRRIDRRGGAWLTAALRFRARGRLPAALALAPFDLHRCTRVK